MGKKRVQRNQERLEAKMDMDGDSGPVAMDGDLPGSTSGYGEVQGEKPNPPRVKKPTVRRNIQLRKKEKLEKALNRVEKASLKQEKQKSKKEMKKTLKKMY
mmetsp:Transcript_14543/g.31157  ORF Transcript_14543/g.31157 Transcript_14543/m.31157 type:complete len:101 (-) Transcript_14543:331-633(-)|eukprot:CAMPEP_0118932322 /NCGR_PEP_ID=MMETSP1169-20130426/9861_1 /TAXON_ID=36882 /ORGANISM="Pyramimonas obovata, Strain CCMP722" /LENGTH=100 /DNA_ID=CAMNT_0006874963 /DNA_START=153 /DNA_END=455 /DNA_ORIENTATION=+